jgi:hypothetical protein
MTGSAHVEVEHESLKYVLRNADVQENSPQNLSLIFRYKIFDTINRFGFVQD